MTCSFFLSLWLRSFNRQDPHAAADPLT